ncbi:MAG: hypothetical protein JWP23_417 [Phenylobacterium sp.]|nr:hypothetical protein [Phenylobacterium sp.]
MAEWLGRPQPRLQRLAQCHRFGEGVLQGNTGTGYPVPALTDSFSPLRGEKGARIDGEPGAYFPWAPAAASLARAAVRMLGRP